MTLARDSTKTVASKYVLNEGILLAFRWVSSGHRADLADHPAAIGRLLQFEPEHRCLSRTRRDVGRPEFHRIGRRLRPIRDARRVETGRLVVILHVEHRGLDPPMMRDWHYVEPVHTVPSFPALGTGTDRHQLSDQRDGIRAVRVDRRSLKRFGEQRNCKSLSGMAVPRFRQKSAIPASSLHC